MDLSIEATKLDLKLSNKIYFPWGENMNLNQIIADIESNIIKLENSVDSQNICGSCYDDGRLNTYREILLKLKQMKE